MIVAKNLKRDGLTVHGARRVEAFQKYPYINVIHLSTWVVGRDGQFRNPGLKAKS